MSKYIRYNQRKPWANYVRWARRRCAAKEGSKWWPFYGAKGVKVTLTVREAEILWVRDQAAMLKKPSLDRIDGSQGYTLKNCRFMEWLENVQAPHKGLGLEFCFLNQN